MGLTLRQYRELYEGILRDPSRPRRLLALENLVTALEIAYEIPLLKETGWGVCDEPVLELYRDVYRSLEEERRFGEGEDVDRV